MPRYRMVASDVDGTLTERRGNLLLSLEAVRAVRLLEQAGIRVSLVSGNSLPITAGLARYMGATGPSVAENGCTIFYEGRVIHVCQGRPPEELVEALRRLGLRESWQNPYRHHDLAFYVDPERLGEAVRIVEEYGMAWYYSGYALHVQPPGGGKARGVEVAASLLGISMEEVFAVGDGENDIPMLEKAGGSGCPADAAEEVKRIVYYVASQPGGRGFAEIARMILEERL